MGMLYFGLMVPDIVFGRWLKENSIKQNIEANRHYYFLLSPTLLGNMEIEKIEQKEAKERLSSSTLIKTGTLSTNPGIVGNAIAPIAKFIGLEEKKE